MILCLCKGISDREIRKMAREGHTLRQIQCKSEASTCCGACIRDLTEIVKNESPNSDQSNSSTD